MELQLFASDYRHALWQDVDEYLDQHSDELSVVAFSEMGGGFKILDAPDWVIEDLSAILKEDLKGDEYEI